MGAQNAYSAVQGSTSTYLTCSMSQMINHLREDVSRLAITMSEVVLMDMLGAHGDVKEQLRFIPTV